MPEALHLSPADRLLIVAPHPDDDILAAAGLLQATVAAGAAVRVAYFTDGENNPWAQRATERRLLIGDAARRAFGARRRQEALAALDVLGVGGDAVSFLACPDQGMTHLLLAGDQGCGAPLIDLLREWRPSVIVGPSLHDLHPDHSALAVLLRTWVAGQDAAPEPVRRLAYVVHNPSLRQADGSAITLGLGPEQVERKRHAIGCHRSQLFWRRAWLLGFAAAQERFWAGDAPAELAGHPLRGAAWREDALVLPLASHSLARAFGARTVLVAGTLRDGAPLRLAVRVPGRTSATTVVDPRNRRELSVARFTGTPQCGELSLPRELLAGSPPFFAKLERRFGFFDEAGWIELPAPPPALH